MNCNTDFNILLNYADNILRKEERNSFEKHLATCQVCKRYLMQIRNLQNLMPSLLLNISKKDCPDGEAKSDYSLGVLDENKKATLKKHFNECAICFFEVSTAKYELPPELAKRKPSKEFLDKLSAELMIPLHLTNKAKQAMQAIKEEQGFTKPSPIIIKENNKFYLRMNGDKHEFTSNNIKAITMSIGEVVIKEYAPKRLEEFLSVREIAYEESLKSEIGDEILIGAEGYQFVGGQPQHEKMFHIVLTIRTLIEKILKRLSVYSENIDLKDHLVRDLQAQGIVLENRLVRLVLKVLQLDG